MSDKEITEVTFEVAIRHYVTADTPNPSEDDIHTALVNAPVLGWLDLEQITVERI